MVRMFTKAWETWVQSQLKSYQRLKKWYLLYTQHYKVRIKGKVERPPQHLGVVAIQKGSFESPSTTVANFTLLICRLFIYRLYRLIIYIYIGLSHK